MIPMDAMNGAVLNANLALFSKISGLIGVLVGAIFVGRVTFVAIRIGPHYEYFEVLKDTVLYFIWILLFPTLVGYLFDAIHSIANQLSFTPQTNTAVSIVDVIATPLFGFSFRGSGQLASFVINKLAIVGYSIMIGLLLAIAPIVIFLNVLLGISHGMRSYFSILLSMALWPILWNLIGMLGNEVWEQFSVTKLSAVIFWVIIQGLQLFSPLFSFALFKSLSAEGVFSKMKGIAPL